MVSTPEELDALVREKGVVVVDYWATWCAPCRSYSPKFQRLEREMRRAFPDRSFAFVSIDIDAQQSLARDAKVMSVPTTVAWTMKRGWFGRERRKEALRYSGDRSWPDMVRAFSDLLSAR